MGQNIKMFVATKKKDPFQIVKLINSAFKENFFYNNIINREVKGVKRFEVTINGEAKALLVRFSIDDEPMSMYVFFDCSNDYKDVYEGEKIIFDSGIGEVYEKVMLSIIEKVKFLGNVYYTPNDCKEEPKIKYVHI